MWKPHRKGKLLTTPAPEAQSALVRGYNTGETCGAVRVACPVVSRHLRIRAERTSQRFRGVADNFSRAYQPFRRNAFFHPLFQCCENVVLRVGARHCAITEAV